MLGPIFAREWLTLPRRSNHYVARSAYLGLFWILGLTSWQATLGWNREAGLGDNAHFGTLLFQIFIFVQLTVLVFFSALSAAGAIAQEKDRRTFVLLLLTDLRAYEIVLGKLLGSLLQIGFMLAGMVPAMAMMILLGGISLAQVWQATLVLAASAVAAGSAGALVALWREKTFQVLAMTVLFLVLYFCAVEGVFSLFNVILDQTSDSWKMMFNPFLALQEVIDLQPDLAGGLPPAYGYVAVMIFVSVMLNAWGMYRLRVWNPSGEPIMQRERPEEEEKDRTKAHAAPGTPRQVWANPILWREIRTNAYGRRPLLVKAAFILVVGLICYFALAPQMASGGKTAFAAANGLIPVGILSLLLVTVQAVTSITSERDGGGLDLLLATDLTPKEFIFGKLGGIIYNVKEYLAALVILAAVYSWYGLLASPPREHPDKQKAQELMFRAEVLADEGTEARNITLLFLFLASLAGFAFLLWRWPEHLNRIFRYMLLSLPAWSALLAGNYLLLAFKLFAIGNPGGAWNLEAFLFFAAGTLVLMLFAMVLGIHVALRTHNSRLAVTNTLATVFFLSAGTLACMYIILINSQFEYQWTSFIFFIAAGIGGFWWVLNGDRPSAALTMASTFCPVAVLYCVTNVLVAKPGSVESTDPLMPFLVCGAAFGFAVAAMLIPLLSEFDIALGRTTRAEN